MKSNLITLFIVASIVQVFAQKDKQQTFIAYENRISLTYRDDSSTYLTTIELVDKNAIHQFKNIEHTLDTSLSAVGLVYLKRKKAHFHSLWKNYNSSFNRDKKQKWTIRNSDSLMFINEYGRLSRAKIIEDSIIRNDDFGNYVYDYLLVPISKSENDFNKLGLWINALDSAREMTSTYNFAIQNDRNYIKSTCSLTSENYSFTLENEVFPINWKGLNINILLNSEIFNVLEIIDDGNVKIESYYMHLEPNALFKELYDFKKLELPNYDSIKNAFIGNWRMESGVLLKTSLHDSTSLNKLETDYSFSFHQADNDAKFEMIYKNKSKVNKVTGSWEVGQTGKFLELNPDSDKFRSFELSLNNFENKSFTFTLIDYELADSMFPLNKGMTPVHVVKMIKEN